VETVCQINRIDTNSRYVDVPNPNLLFSNLETSSLLPILFVYKLCFYYFRILIAAPSNAAADLICKYLVELGKYGTGEFVRLVGYNRADSNYIPELIQPYCKDGENIEAICKYRIIVCTCNSAGQFFQMDPKLTALHVSHVFIDEAGYCSEPDTLIPCLFVCHNLQAQVCLDYKMYCIILIK